MTRADQTVNCEMFALFRVQYRQFQAFKILWFSNSFLFSTATVVTEKLLPCKHQSGSQECGSMKRANCLGPRGLRRGLHNRNIPYTTVHQSKRTANSSLIVHWISLNCHSSAIKQMNVAVSKQVPSECLRKKCILRVLRTKRQNWHAKKYSS